MPMAMVYGYKMLHPEFREFGVVLQSACLSASGAQQTWSRSRLPAHDLAAALLHRLVAVCAQHHRRPRGDHEHVHDHIRGVSHEHIIHDHIRGVSTLGPDQATACTVNVGLLSKLVWMAL